MLNEQENLQEFFKEVPESFLVKTIAFTSDVYIENAERDYILGFKNEAVITRNDIVCIFSLLKMKNKFSTATLEMTPCEDGFNLAFTLEGLWTFNKVIVRGLLTGAEKYSHYYLMEYGEFFDITKHQHSLEKIKETLMAEGFFNAEVLDYLHYDTKRKMVTVTLILNTGYQFVIHDVVCTVTSDQKMATEPLAVIKKLETVFVARLKGSYYSQALLTREVDFLKNYLAKKGFFNPSIKVEKEFDYGHDRLTLVFKISLHQKKAFAFFGNHFFSNKELFDMIFAFGRSTAFLPDSFLSQEIIEAYQRKGFCDVQVECKQEEKRNFFIIKEGVRRKVNAVQVHGVGSLDVATIQSFFAASLKGPFDEDMMRQALQKVVNYYLKEGFSDVKIVSQDYIPGTKPATYTLVMNIYEGERRYIQSALVEGFPELSLQGPFAQANKQLPVPFDANQIQVQRQWLMNYFQQQGYLYVVLSPDITYLNNLVNILWKVSGIDRTVTFGKVVVLGSSTFSFESLVRELPFHEGDVWQKEKLEDSLKRLRRLGVFETIYLSPHNIAQQEDQKAIIVKVREDDPFEVRLRAGFQQVSTTLLEFRKGTTYKVGGMFLYKNPFNAGDSFCVDTDFTRYYRNVFVAYQRPWFFSLPLTTVIKGYSNKYIQPVIMGSNKPLYRAIQQGFLMSVNRCCNSFNYGGNVGLEFMEINDLSVSMAEAINFGPILIDKTIPYFYFEPNLVFDLLDNDMNPTTGSLTIFSCRAMISLIKAAPSFIKVIFEQSVFFPLRVISSVFGLRLRLGHIFNQEFRNIVPPERFYLGGQNSIRSYEPDFGPPLGSFVEDNGKRVLAPQGGKSMFNMNFEFRFPLVWKIGGVIFQDVGFLADRSLTEIIKSHFIAASGFGLRYYAPIGPVRFDIGWKWKKYAPEEYRYAWFLTLGHAF